MTRLDDRLIPKALDLIQRFGTSATFTVETLGAYDPSTGGTAPSTSVDHVAPVSPPGDYSKSFGESLTVSETDTQILLPTLGLTFTPALNMKVLLDGETHRIGSFKKVYTGEQVALYWIILNGN